MNTKKNISGEGEIKSFSLLDNSNTALILIDFQEKLIKGLGSKEILIKNINKLIDTFYETGLEIYVTEQNPKKLGFTSDKLNLMRINKFEKMDFSCISCKGLIERLQSRDIKNIILCGVETHICILQSALEMMNIGFCVHVMIDGTTSRNEIDHTTGIRRMETSGIIISSCETAIFELCKTATNSSFRKISEIIKRN